LKAMTRHIADDPFEVGDTLRQLSTQTTLYYESDQTIIFYDWDDTLFPTEAIIRYWGMEIPKRKERVLTLDQESELEAWREALLGVLETARQLSSKVCIITNAGPGWVDTCISEFAPNLKDIIDGLTIVYARDHLRTKRSFLYRQMTRVHPARHGSEASDLEVKNALTMAKYFAMKDAAMEFYSQYEYQTWKNILSFGDSTYECDALKDLAFRRVPPRGKEERLRAKCLLLPTSPSVSELTLRLRFHKLLLKTYVDVDRDFDLDLTAATDPLSEIGKALDLPRLASLPWLSHAWGLEKAPQQKKAELSLAALAEILEERDRRKPSRPMTPSTQAPVDNSITSVSRDFDVSSQSSFDD
jgi:hypothetical protein